jgi:hypothetical protein
MLIINQQRTIEGHGEYIRQDDKLFPIQFFALLIRAAFAYGWNI